MNSNLFHNIVNVVMILISLTVAVLTALGCTQLPTGDLECSQSVISPSIATAIVGGLGIAKMIVNVVRDGVAGLAKKQPPVQP